MTLSSQLLWNYWSDIHKTWYVDRTSYGVMHVGRKFWSPHFCGSYAPWNLENIRKSTNNLSFLCQFFIKEINASDAGPDIIRSHLFICWSRNMYSRYAASSLGRFLSHETETCILIMLHHLWDVFCLMKQKHVFSLCCSMSGTFFVL